MSRPPRGDLLLIVVGVLGVSTSGPIIAALAVPPLAIAFWRNAFGTAALAPYALLRHRDELRDLHGRSLWLTFAAGGLLAAHFAFWVPSLAFTSVASSTALVCMQAVWAALFGRLVGHSLSTAAWAGMLLAIVGVLLVTGVDFLAVGPGARRRCPGAARRRVLRRVHRPQGARSAARCRRRRTPSSATDRARCCFSSPASSPVSR